MCNPNSSGDLDKKPDAKTVSFEITIDGDFLGSLPWSSPEQARGKKSEIGPWTDVYSLGVVLYQLLTGGQFPYEVIGSMRDVLDNILNVTPEPPSTVRAKVQSLNATVVQSIARGACTQQGTLHPIIDAIVLKSLAKKTAERYETANEFATDVENYLAGKPTIASLRTILPSPDTRPRFRKRLALVCLLACFIAVVGWFIISWNEGHRLSFLFTLSQRQQDEEVVTNKIAERLPRNHFEETVKSQSAATTFDVIILDHGGRPLAEANCRLVVGGYPTDERGFPTDPDPLNVLVGKTDGDGTMTFEHVRLNGEKQHMLYINKKGFCGAHRSLTKSDIASQIARIVLFRKNDVTIRYAFQPAESRNFLGNGVLEGSVKLHPMQGGGYRLPARAHFSFLQARRVGGGGRLEYFGIRNRN